VFAHRAAWDLSPSPVFECLEARRARGLPVLDLSDANPTHCGLGAAGSALSDALAEVARDPASRTYDPDPRGPRAAREAIATYHACAGAPVTADHVVLTAGTSEGYAHLFRLLADPDDVVHLPSPGYPLFEHLAAAEGVGVRRYPLRPMASGPHWRLDLEALEASLGPRSRAVLLIHPHNPTGSFVGTEDLGRLREICRRRGLCLVSDEVFSDYGFVASSPPSALAGADAGPLHFGLSGASKVLALPQLKLAWITVAGPAAARDEALARLEFLADAYLSVSPLLAAALPDLLARRHEIQAPLRARLAANRAWLARRLADHPRISIADSEAGWCALLRATGASKRGLPDEDALTLDLLEHSGVLVQPGFLFDLEPEWQGEPCAHWIVSLLLEPTELVRGVDALIARL